MKPGADTAEIAKKAWPDCSTWGYKEEYECWTNALGHGLGLTQYEPPMMGRSFWGQTLEEGMTIALETWYGEDGVGGCRIEDMVVVTKDGIEILSTWPNEGISVPEWSLIGLG